jgi:hypothetical protein
VTRFVDTEMYTRRYGAGFSGSTQNL